MVWFFHHERVRPFFNPGASATACWRSRACLWPRRVRARRNSRPTSRRGSADRRPLTASAHSRATVTTRRARCAPSATSTKPRLSLSLSFIAPKNRANCLVLYFKEGDKTQSASHQISQGMCGPPLYARAACAWLSRRRNARLPSEPRSAAVATTRRTSVTRFCPSQGASRRTMERRFF